MAEQKRLRGRVSCCDGGTAYWDSPYIIGPYGRPEVRGILTQPEADAITLIEGHPLWTVNADGSRSLPPAGLPHAALTEWKRREDAAVAVIRAGGGEVNRIADTWPMDADWYRSNGTAPNVAMREQHNIQATQRADGHKTIAHRGVTLWCKGCESAADQLLAGLAYAGQEITPFMTAVALAASYIPVLGTAVSFIINTAVNLAKGQDFSEATLDAIGMALPGQPLTGAAYEVARGIARGDALDEIAIGQLPIDDGSKRAISTAVGIAKAIAGGEAITEVALNAIHQQLNEQGREAMSYARRLMNGEKAAVIAIEMANSRLDNLREMIDRVEKIQEAALAAKNSGPEAQRVFIAQAGYQGALGSVSKELAEAVQAGLISGRTEVMRGIEMRGFTTAERNPQTLDEWATKGQLIINGPSLHTDPTSGIVKSLAAIRAAPSNTLVRNERFDALSGRMLPGRWVEVIPMTGPARRGFDVAIGVCEGKHVDGPGQQAVRASLTLLEAQKGFDLGQYVQYNRTLQSQLLERINQMAIAAARVKYVPVTPEDKSKLANGTAKGQMMAARDPAIASARSLNTDGRFRWGFDFATALCEGMEQNGPGQQAWRERVGPFAIGTGPNGSNGTVEAQQGFDVGQALQHGIAKARRAQGLPPMPIVDEAIRFQINPQPDVAAGMLLATGLAGSGQPGDIKAGVIEQTLNNPGAKQGAATVIAEKTGFFTKILEFFGLA